MDILGWQRLSQSDLVQEQPVLPTRPSQLSATVRHLIGSVEGLTGTTRIRTSARRGWEGKSVIWVGKEVPGRSWSL